MHTQVAAADLRNFYDAFIWRGKVYFLAQRPHDETFDFSTISILDLNARGSPLRIQPLSVCACTLAISLSCILQPDPMRGFPPNRRQTGLAMYMGRIYLVGGEIQQANGEWFRFQVVLWSYFITREHCRMPGRYRREIGAGSRYSAQFHCRL